MLKSNELSKLNDNVPQLLGTSWFLVLGKSEVNEFASTNKWNIVKYQLLAIQTFATIPSEHSLNNKVPALSCIPLTWTMSAIVKTRCTWRKRYPVIHEILHLIFEQWKYGSFLLSQFLFFISVACFSWLPYLIQMCYSCCHNNHFCRCPRFWTQPTTSASELTNKQRGGKYVGWIVKPVVCFCMTDQFRCK